MDIIQQYYQSFLQTSMQHLTNLLGPRGIAITLSIISTTYDIVRAFAVFNWRILGSIIDEFSPIGNLWVFHDEEHPPLPYRVFGEHPKSAKWFYNKNVNTLYESANCISDRCPPSTCVKLPWIMAHLSLIEKDQSGNEITKTEWYLDEWASGFFMAVYNSFSVSPRVILNCWSLNSGIWLNDNAVYRLQVINKNGEHIEFSDINHPLTEELATKWRSIIGLESMPPSIDPSDSETEPEEGSEAASENSEEEHVEEDHVNTDADSTTNG